MPRLLATHGPLKGRTFPLGGECVIGRDPAGTIVLDETTASRRHAELACRAGAVEVRDLDSRNGTFVNGKKIRKAVLVPGDTLAVGDHTFLFLEDQALSPTAVAAPPRRFQIDSTVSDFEMVGESPAFKACVTAAERLAASDAPVLLTGETGSGKELIARWIHRAGPRAHGPFVALNAAAIPETLFEAELFGAEEGAFTGATARRPGKFELASGGTLFLDEIGELPLALQPKLLRAVQERAFYRVGGTREIAADVRIAAATNRDLAAAAKTGAFREDLYHRLGALLLHVPALRERRDDIPLLARYVAARTARKLGKPSLEPTSAALERLQDYAWPGNIRELQNVVERAVVLAERSELDADAFATLSPASSEPAGSGFTLAGAEREAIRKALEKTGGKRGEAAKLLGISWPTLRRKIRLHKLDRADRDKEQDVQKH